jgi:hypothetical protein
MHIQGLRVIVVVVQAGAVKILYVSSSNGGAQEKNERQDETQFTNKTNF